MNARLDDARCEPAPTRVNGSDRAAIDGGEEYGDTIGGDDSDRDPELPGENDIGLGRLSKGAGCPGFEDLNTVNLPRKDCGIRKLAASLAESVLDVAINENRVA